jgi:hypothetical protein
MTDSTPSVLARLQHVRFGESLKVRPWSWPTGMTAISSFELIYPDLAVTTGE